MSTKPLALLAMEPDLPDRLFDGSTRQALDQVCEVDFGRVVHSFDQLGDDVLARVEILISGWGSPRVDATVLDRAPRLRGVLHAAGSVRGHVHPECWARGVVVSTAADVNALPVAEYSVAMILLAGKEVFRAQHIYRERRGQVDQRLELADVGNYRRIVGIVGASRIGRRVVELLRPYDLDLRMSDPYLSPEMASTLGVTLMALDDLLAVSHVVSLHAPLLPTTRHLIDGRRLGLIRDGATLINTARGGLVEFEPLVAELTSGRLWAVLDVTDPHEPPAADSALYALPNVLLTPHVAGALGNELFRMGGFAVDETRNLLAGRPLVGNVTLEDLERMA
jgi:phosphoglycerate dehydrogenase-like enzyme